MKDKGFTLVEILVSIFIITMLALLTAPITIRILYKIKKETFVKNIRLYGCSTYA